METALWKTRLLRRIFYNQFNEVEPKQQESINSDEAELWLVNLQINTGPDSECCAIPLIDAMLAAFVKKMIFKEYCVTDRNINLVGLDWVDELNLIQFPDENENCQTPTLEPANVTDILHPSVHNQSPELDSLKTQL
ncbi:hypothetical protein ACTXT7_016552 [Hymenolepis weldensis]